MRKDPLLVLCAVAALAGCLDEESESNSGPNAEIPGPGETSPVNGTTNSVVMNGFFLGKGYAVFFSPQGDAKFTTTWPTRVDEFDIAAASAKDPKNAGKWRTSGDKLTIAFGGGDTWVCRLLSPERFQIESGRKGDTGYVSRPVKVAPSIVGQFKRGNYSLFGVDNTGTASGSVSGDHWVTFTAEGTVIIRDTVSVFINGELLVDDKVQKGSYAIDGYTITITEANGKVTKKDLWVSEGTSAAPRLLVFGSSVYLAR